MGKSPLTKNRNSISFKKKRSAIHSKCVQMWGIHPVLEALNECPQAILEITIDREKAGRAQQQIIKLADKNSIPVNCDPGKLRTAGRKPGHAAPQDQFQGVSALIVVPAITLEELTAGLDDLNSPPLLLALDSIQDPHNLGAIIRSAVAAGANGIILPKDRSSPITGTVIKISAGAVFHIHICWVTNLVSSLKLLKTHGIWIFGTAKEGARPVYDTDLTVPACLVIGSEGKGLRPLVAAECDLHVTIPMQSSLDSLNASVAAGIIVFEMARQRRTLSG